MSPGTEAAPRPRQRADRLLAGRGFPVSSTSSPVGGRELDEAFVFTLSEGALSRAAFFFVLCGLAGGATPAIIAGAPPLSSAVASRARGLRSFSSLRR